jgi:hypothetical protein
MNVHACLRVVLTVVLGVVPLLLSCGGGGGGSSAPPVTPKAPGIYGTAASGTAHVRRPIDGSDKDGNPINGDTDGNGNFILPTNGRTPPYLLRVITSTTPTTMLYSVSADENAATTINITPLTDLIIRSWYSAQTPSVNIDYAFNNLPTHPAPKPESVSVIHNLIKNVVQLWLDKNGVTNTDFNLISTPFTAGTISVPGTGFDKVLDQAWVNAATGQIVISNGTTTQNSTLNAFLSSLTASTTTVSVVTGSTVDSGSIDMTIVTTDAAKQAALAGINTLLANFTNMVNAKGTSLVYTDLLPYIDPDPNMKHNGANRDQLAKILTSGALSAFSVGKTKLYSVKAIYSLDASSAEMRITGTGMPSSTFKLVSGSWLISGNGRSGNIWLDVSMTTRQGAYTPGDGMYVAAGIQAPPGKVTAVTLDGGGIWSAVTYTQHDTKIGPYGNMDNFYFDSGVLSNPPTKGTPFTVMLTTPTGTENYTIPSNAYTTEPIRITNLSGTALSTVTPGSELTVNWTKPTTFPINKMALSYQAWNGSGVACLGDGTVSDQTIPTGKVTIPALCNGSSVTRVHVYVGALGVNGEWSKVTYTAQ